MDARALAERFIDTVLVAGELDRSLYTADATGWHNVDEKVAHIARVPDDAMKALGNLCLEVGPIDVEIDTWPTGFVIRYVMSGTFRNGEKLRAPACVVGIVRDGRIAAIREYLDSAHFAAAARA